MLKENSILKLNKNILKRYEHTIDQGVLFLFNVESEEIWTGNESSNDLLKLINGTNSIKKIYEALIPLYEGYEYAEIKESFDNIIIDLLNTKFIEFV